MTDETDKALLAILKRNARESVSSIARKLGLSRSTVQDRLSRMETCGPIRGYTVLLEADTTQSPIRAFVTIIVEPQRTGIIIKELGTFAGIKTVHTVSGNFDLLVEIRGEDIANVNAVIDRISDIPGVNKTETSIVLSTKYET